MALICKYIISGVRSWQDLFFFGNPQIWNHQNLPVLLLNSDTAYPNLDAAYSDPYMSEFGYGVGLSKSDFFFFFCVCVCVCMNFVSLRFSQGALQE